MSWRVSFPRQHSTSLGISFDGSPVAHEDGKGEISPATKNQTTALVQSFGSVHTNRSHSGRGRLLLREGGSISYDATPSAYFQVLVHPISAGSRGRLSILNPKSWSLLRRLGAPLPRCGHDEKGEKETTGYESLVDLKILIPTPLQVVLSQLCVV